MIAATLLASAAVFHGSPVPPDQTPWLVTLTTRGVVCGGALIAPDRVLTAAHCVQGADPGRVSVRLRGVRQPWRGAFFPSSYRLIPAPVAPEDPRAAATIDDLAVIVLRSPVRDVPTLPVADPAPVVGEGSLTVGNGGTGPVMEKGPRAAAQQVSGDCPAAYGATLFHPDRHLCTLDPTPNASQACAGDSGSPVMVMRNGAWAVAGVVTWGGETHGRGCGEGLPDVSERVGAHLPLLTAQPSAYAPFAERRVRVRRSGAVRRCVIGAWHPAKATFKVRWWRRGASGKLTYLPGGGTTRRLDRAAGCSVTATTAGGWATEDSYNQL
jgi:Trypsin